METTMIPFGGASIDVREAQWATKREALQAVKAIGWTPADLRRVERLGFLLWVIVDAQGAPISQARYSALRIARPR